MNQHLVSLVSLAAMHLLAAMVPGPNTVVVGWVAATVSRRAGFQAALGVAAASLVWVGLALFGVGALLADTGWIYRAFRLAGAAYLLFVGFRLLRRGGRRAGVEGAPPLSARRPFLAGVLTTLSNPKSAVFWTSVFLVAVPPDAPAWLYAAIVAVTGVQALLWYGAVGLMLSSDAAKRSYRRVARALDLLAGGAMTLFGLRLGYEAGREALR
jgi:threonine efflux protein